MRSGPNPHAADASAKSRRHPLPLAEAVNASASAGYATRIRQLLGTCSANATSVDLKHKTLFNTWVKFRRRELAQNALRLPELTAAADGTFRLHLRAAAGKHIKFTLPARVGERFVGFGERFNAVDQRGHKLEVWTEEGAVGFGEFWSPILTRLRAAFNPLPKGPTTAYKPIPWFVSSEGYGLYIATTYPVFFDVGASNPHEVVCDIATSDVELVFFAGESPKDILLQYARATGLPRPLPNWAVGPWNDAVGGAANVERVAKLLRTERIPSCAIWTEDWGGAQWSFAGNTRWSWYNINPVRRTVDRQLYPDLEGLADMLHAQGYKFLSYYYPFIPADDPDFAMVCAKGYLQRDEQGEPLVFPFFTDRCGQIDLTNPEARAWYGAELKRGTELGFDGWMADFGEYTPVNSRMFDGQSGLQHHNAYPLLWAQLNREVWEAARPNGDFMFFSRSGAPGQQAASPLFWSGDSNTDFERWDGLPSNLPALLSAAMSGIAVWTTDLGGYMSLITKGRDPETLARWTEFAALLPVMRTHHGTHPRRSVQFDHSAATLRHYAVYARLHTALFPLLRRLLDEASETGTPVCRPFLLEYPDDPRSWQVEDAFLLGADLVVAPVLKRGAKGRQVYLPAGERWVDLWSGSTVDGGQSLWVDAPLGKIPLFLRDGASLVVFGRYVDTLVSRSQVGDGPLATIEDGEEHLLVVLTPNCTGTVPCYGATQLAVGHPAVGAQLPSATPPTPADLQTVLPGELVRNWQPLASVSGQTGVANLGGDRALTIASTQPRQFTIYAVGTPG